MFNRAFDSYSLTYDEHFTNTAIGRLQRERVHIYLRPLLKRQDNVLELNCGTGEDASFMASSVLSVYATDQSEGMIIAAMKKSSNDNIKFDVCSIENISSIGAGKSFDLIFSNFGGINCVPPIDVKKCSRDLYQLSNKGGHIALVIMGKRCLWEMFYFLYKKRDKSFRRLSAKGISTQIGNENFLTYYYSPSQIKKIFKEHFEIQYHRPIGLFIPPSYLNSFFENKAWLLKILYHIEKVLGRFSILSNYADHYLIVLKK